MMTNTEVQHAKITNEMLAQARSRIGEVIPLHSRWNEVATKDAIKHWAWGIGDLNPLWLEEEYARKTNYGCIVAPPTFLMSCSIGPLWHRNMKGSRGAGMTGLHGLWAGDTWEWYQPILVDDRIDCATTQGDLLEKKSSYVGRMFKRDRETIYKNQRGEVVAKLQTHRMAFERGTPKKKKKYTAITKHRYTDEELRAIGDDYDKEEIRGANPRYWEDVREGEAITHVVKGPLSVTSIITFLMGWGSPFCMTDKMAHEYLRAHPAAGIRDPETNVPDFPERAHWDPWFAEQIGFSAGGYDIGGQRISWLGHLMTNWIGDDGLLKKLHVELRRPHFLSDTLWCRGKVTRKYIQEGEHLVDCDIWGENQRGERPSIGWATVRLPTRS